MTEVRFMLCWFWKSLDYFGRAKNWCLVIDFGGQILYYGSVRNEEKDSVVKKKQDYF